MIPAPFDYHAPASLAEAIGLLQQHGDEAKVLSGGQSLLPLLKLRLASAGHLVDIGRIPGPRVHQGRRRLPEDRRPDARVGARALRSDPDEVSDPRRHRAA